MSKIGKKPIPIPLGVEIIVSGQNVRVKGPKGELSRDFPADFDVRSEAGSVIVIPPKVAQKNTRALWGTIRMHIANMVDGVMRGFEKKLEFEGIGFKAEVSGSDLVLSVGFIHPVRIHIPPGISVKVAKNVISVSGVDKEAVGQFSALIRRVKPPESYKGVGIRYEGEVIRRKAGKKLAGAAG